MLELTEWCASATFPDRPWLLLGKGPTFDRHSSFDLSQFNTLALNHAAIEVPVDVAHAVDIDVVAACGDRLADFCRWLVMPRYPHVRSTPSDRRLEDYLDEVPVLRLLDKEGRLVWYNLLGSRPEGRSPVVGVRYFSSEAALNILALAGAKTVRSLGIDGGRSYGKAFQHLEDETLLANGRPAFDVQFQQLATIAAEHGMDYRPLVPPLRIFIGTDESQIVAHRVLEYSIRKRASVPVEIVPMLNFPTPEPKSAANRPRTTFSFCRFLIPKLCGYQGRALYLDADMLVFGDIAELADLPFDGKRLQCTFQPEPPAAWRDNGAFHPGRHFAVTLLDCERLPWDVEEIVGGLDDGRYTYEQLMFDFCIVPPEDIGESIPLGWNHLERYEPDVTKLLHFTVVPTQPWKNDENALGEIWMAAYREAVEAGAVPPEEVEALIAAGLVKPSLAAPLRLAPSRRSVLTGPTFDLAMAREQIAILESKLAAARSSWSFRAEESMRRAVQGSKTVLRQRFGTFPRSKPRSPGDVRTG